MKFKLLVISTVLVALVLGGCGKTNIVKASGANCVSIAAADQSPKSTSLLSFMNLNSSAFKDMGRLAFVWNGLIYVLDGKTGEVKQLTSTGQAQQLAWSYDGKWLAFNSVESPTDTGGQLWVVQRDGKQAHQVPGDSFSWSPAADVLATNGTEGLWLIPVDETPHLAVKGSVVSSPYWSPDGKSIAYSVMLPFDKNKPEDRSDALYTLTLSTGQEVRVTTEAGAGIQFAAWWPNGKGLLYWVDPQHSSSIAADGIGLSSLRLGDARVKLLTTGLALRNWLSISPQGRLLTVSGQDRIVWARKSLTIADLESGNTYDLSNPVGNIAIDPSFSPDGKQIAFVAAKDLGTKVWGFSDPDELAKWVATRVLWTMKTDGSDAHPMQSVGEGIYQPMWSKDGMHIMYVKDNSLWITGVNGKNPEKILGPIPDWEVDQLGYYGYIWHDDFAWYKS